ncbi:sulfotransferase [Shewanella eurypsychrophilus]|uniref:Sulfotransferase n=2 Tax=Shewanella TaxID=22 RepID=A0ABX6V6K2_9GAMM|nr:sulfotransferase [Shewanella eurypsychrophilus]QPG58251.2 sulfotransferase [Shewanella eurypsychrophilus]
MFSKDNYSLTEQGIHRLAFGSTQLQSLLLDIEDKLYSQQWQNIEINKPIFITSLPRAGTTLLLELLNQLPELSTYLYRDMPFILTPLIWHKISSRFQVTSQKKERAHADGLKINVDSPEAFEEIVWKRSFPEKYQSKQIPLWTETNCQLQKELHQQMQKQIAVRKLTSKMAVRYVSKNNANIARLNIIKQGFPDAIVLIPFRHPLEQAISLWKQHLHFTAIHAQDNFTYAYMQSIGHFEFGRLHKPLLFPRFNTLTANFSPLDLNYWLAYWISAFSYLLTYSSVSFIHYESLCKSGAKGVKKLLARLDLTADERKLLNICETLNAPPASRFSDQFVDPSLKLESLTLYEALIKRCLLNEE